MIYSPNIMTLVLRFYDLILVIFLFLFFLSMALIFRRKN